jgi:hypothetical protein
MSTTPTRPDVRHDEPAGIDVEKTVRERLDTLEHDKKDAKPWAEVKARILKTPRPR